jgi:hypothetical protein
MTKAPAISRFQIVYTKTLILFSSWWNGRSSINQRIKIIKNMNWAKYERHLTTAWTKWHQVTGLETSASWPPWNNALISNLCSLSEFISSQRTARTERCFTAALRTCLSAFSVGRWHQPSRESAIEFTLLDAEAANGTLHVSGRWKHRM